MPAASPDDLPTAHALKSTPEGTTQAFNAILLLRATQTRRAKNGSEFLVVELADNTGSFQITCFSDSTPYAFFRQTPEGTMLRVEGFTAHYQGRFSPRITHTETIPSDAPEYGQYLSRLTETPPENPDALWEELQGYIGSITHEPLRATARHALDEHAERFRLTPAAIAMHHAYRHGLLEHTTRMCRAAKALLPLYPEVHHDLALAGVLLHDIGKTLEYEGDSVARRTRAGLLQGHVVLGYRTVRKAALQCRLDPDLTERLEHIILSHQGELEWGAAAMAATPEAVFVSMIDNLDAKMGMIQRALRQAKDGESFGDYLPGLKASPLLTPPHTPA